MNEDFDILEYISSLTGFSFDRAVLKRIAMERGVLQASSIDDITTKDKDLITADLLYVIYLSPTSTSSMTKQHGAFSQTIGSQTIEDKDDIYNMLLYLYRKWNDDKLEEVESIGGDVQWLPY